MRRRFSPLNFFLIVGLGTAVAACVDALRLEPPSSDSSSSTTTATVGSGGNGGSGGSGPVACLSNSDCPEPTSVCDTTKSLCVECLVLDDCAFRPGTVCDAGSCNCPNDETWCAADVCVDTKTDASNCGSCDRKCFGACTEGACVGPWEPTAEKDAPTQRSEHVAVWTGTEMVIWGGGTSSSPTSALRSGGRYNLATREWKPTSEANAPTPRLGATAVWTGSAMLVWGGIDNQGNRLGDGGSYDPATDTWTPINSNSAPAGRSAHTAVWDGTQMIVWGGRDENNDQLKNGGRYNPSDDSWSATAAVPLPSESREMHTAVYDSANGQMILYGGVGDSASAMLTNTVFPTSPVPGGRKYDPSANTWDVLVPQSGEPSARSMHTAVFDGSRVLFFGGRDDSSIPLSDGYKFEGGWSGFNGEAPSARYQHTAVWLDGKKRMMIFGGRNQSSVLESGGIYDPAANTWEAAPSTALPGRYLHTAVSTGDKMIVWGGATSLSSSSSVRSNAGGVFSL
jgi:N-acetylneuraminic acid mutarotase